MANARSRRRDQAWLQLLTAAAAGLPLLLVACAIAGSSSGHSLLGPGASGLAKLSVPAFAAIVLVLLEAVVFAFLAAAPAPAGRRQRAAITGAVVVGAALVAELVVARIACTAARGPLALVLTAVAALAIGAGICRIAVRWRRTPEGKLAVALPGELWWAAVPFEERRGEKDRPCLVLGVNGRQASILMVTSQDHSGRHGYVPMPASVWHKPREGTSWLRTDRLIKIDREKFRRREGVVDDRTWSIAAKAQPRAASERPNRRG